MAVGAGTASPVSRMDSTPQVEALGARRVPFGGTDRYLVQELSGFGVGCLNTYVLQVAGLKKVG